MKKRTRRNVKFDRAIQGATLEQILQKRNQTQDVRKAQREQLIRFVPVHPTRSNYGIYFFNGLSVYVITFDFIC